MTSYQRLVLKALSIVLLGMAQLLSERKYGGTSEYRDMRREIDRFLYDNKDNIKS